jgi:alpha-tubulin suppressor-like RCC1 family protein
VLSWGLDSYSGCLGLGEIYFPGVRNPTNIIEEEGILKNRKIIDISAGNGHSLILSNEGIIFSFGENSFGKLVLFFLNFFFKIF